MGEKNVAFEAFKVSLTKVSGVSNGSNDRPVRYEGHLDVAAAAAVAGHRLLFRIL